MTEEERGKTLPLLAIKLGRSQDNTLDNGSGAGRTSSGEGGGGNRTVEYGAGTLT